MKHKITIAMDNIIPISGAAPFLAEHGLSMLLETGAERLLLDTGQSAALLHNLSLLGVSPASLDLIVISHGHYDHKSGETSLFLANSDHELARVTATQLLERLARLR